MLSFLSNIFMFIIAIGIVPICFLEMQYRDPTEQFLPKISITLIIIGVLIFVFSNENGDKEEELEEREEPYQYNDNIYYDSNNKEYNNGYKRGRNWQYYSQNMGNNYNLKENTKMNLNKLYKTKEFNQMCLKKGKNWKNKFISFNNENLNKIKKE